MAHEIKKKVKAFHLGDSPVVEENERILEHGEKNSQLAISQPVTDASQPVTNQQTTGMAMAMAQQSKAQKKENGVTVYVPMDYYEKLALMKMRLRVPIKDLALQAILEFIDRNNV